MHCDIILMIILFWILKKKIIYQSYLYIKVVFCTAFNTVVLVYMINLYKNKR